MGLARLHTLCQPKPHSKWRPLNLIRHTAALTALFIGMYTRYIGSPHIVLHFSGPTSCRIYSWPCFRICRSVQQMIGLLPSKHQVMAPTGSEMQIIQGDNQFLRISVPVYFVTTVIEAGLRPGQHERPTCGQRDVNYSFTVRSTTREHNRAGGVPCLRPLGARGDAAAAALNKSCSPSRHQNSVWWEGKATTRLLHASRHTQLRPASALYTCKRI